MSLSSHPYRFFTEQGPFMQLWQRTLDKLAGDRVLSVMGVWDLQENSWFDDAPMLLELTSGTLFVHVSGENSLAVGWNDILHSEAPVWLDEKERDWSEELCWRCYEPVRQAFGKRLEGCAPYCDAFGLRGLTLTLSGGGTLQIGNAGDVIFAYYHETKSE